MDDPRDFVPTLVEPARYEPPRFETIDLACEISAYAPDDAEPLF